jgi:hypothetical protein
MPPSSAFGSWYDEQKASENGDTAGGSSSSWFSVDSEQMLPLFNTENLQGLSFDSMKQSMEAQMPKKIMGMGYQQRFKVCMYVSMFVCVGVYVSVCLFVCVDTKIQCFALDFMHVPTYFHILSIFLR